MKNTPLTSLEDSGDKSDSPIQDGVCCDDLAGVL